MLQKNGCVFSPIDKIIIDSIDNDVTRLGLEGREAETFSKCRVNQSIFRNLLINRYKSCCICGASNETILVASHIKPWCKSLPIEKLDVDNGFLMCANHDSLFDSGLISFDDNGNIMISDTLSFADRNILGIKSNIKIKLTNGNKKYLKYHRANIFRK